jgi:hypothetical protein
MRVWKTSVIVILIGIVVSWPTASLAQQPPAPAQGEAEDLAKTLVVTIVFVAAFMARGAWLF